MAKVGETTLTNEHAPARRWKFVFFIALAVYCVGAVAGFLEEATFITSEALDFAYLGCIGSGAIALLVAFVGLAATLAASSAVAAGAASLFMALVMPMIASRWGFPLNVDGGAGIYLGILVSVLGIGGIVLLVVGFIRTASAPE